MYVKWDRTKRMGICSFGEHLQMTLLLLLTNYREWVSKKYKPSATGRARLTSLSAATEIRLSLQCYNTHSTSLPRNTYKLRKAK